MKTKTIYILTILTLILLSSSCMREKYEPLSSEMLQQIALLPQDSPVLGYMNFQKIQNNPFFDICLNSTDREFLYDDDYQEFVEATGFDFKKDAEEVYFSSSIENDDYPNDVLFIAFGKFDTEKISDYIESEDKHHELIKTSYNDIDLYHIEDKDQVFGFIKGNTLVGGTEELVKSWIDKVQNNSEKKKIAPALMKRINQVKYKNHSWLIVDTSPLLELINTNSDRRLQAMKFLKKAVISFKVTEKFNFHSELECTDAEKADLLEDTIRGFISTAKLSVSDDREAVDILNKIDTDTKGNNVKTKFSMTKDDFEKLIQKKDYLHKQIS